MLSLPSVNVLLPEFSSPQLIFSPQDRVSYSGRSSTESAGGLGRQVISIYHFNFIGTC